MRQAPVRPTADDIVTLPNLLTLSRLPMAAALWVSPEDRSWLLGWLGAAAATDMVDGRVARALRERRVRRGADPGALGQAGAIGAWLDPLCDKLFAISLVVAVAVGVQPPWWVAVLLLSREILLFPVFVLGRTLPRWRRVRYDFRAGMAGKLATAAQLLAVVVLLVRPAAAPPLAVVAGILGAVAAASYSRRAIHALREHRLRECALRPRGQPAASRGSG